MRIIVCIKQVPNTSEVKINPDGTLKRDGVPSIINPDDKAGLEFALTLKQQNGAEVTVITIGPMQAKKALAEAVAMGADNAILLTDRAFAGADTLATSKALAAALKTLGYDLIITGRQAIDGDTAQVGPQIAEHLDIPQVSYVTSLECLEDGYKVRRQFEDGYQLLKVPSPALFTVLSSAVKPRYMRVSGIMNVTENLDEAIKTMTAADINVDLAQLGLKGSPTKVKETRNKEYNANHDVRDGLDSKEAAKLIVEKLQERHII
ncbi:MAG: electron transfer flavoprotein subunit beta/FixA family protein [Bacilli bacterium]|nr:electron transfer flavoprotein subunit beta/FixA family protein [Bacilli bacterium]